MVFPMFQEWNAKATDDGMGIQVPHWRIGPCFQGARMMILVWLGWLVMPEPLRPLHNRSKQVCQFWLCASHGWELGSQGAKNLMFNQEKGYAL